MKFYHNPWFNFYCIGDSTIADNKEICLRSITANDLGKAIGFSLIAYPFTSSYSYSCNPFVIESGKVIRLTTLNGLNYARSPIILKEIPVANIVISST